jgi:chromosome segregation ATPase
MDITESTILSIEEKIHELQSQKNVLTTQKRSVEAEMAEIKSRIRTGGQLKQDEYNVLVKRQNTLRGDLHALEHSIASINSEIQKKHILKDGARQNKTRTKSDDILEELKEMKDYYINFAADRTRVASLRALSAEFGEKLELLIDSHKYR